jgi:hypothetical protein
MNFALIYEIVRTEQIVAKAQAALVRHDADAEALTRPVLE